MGYADERSAPFAIDAPRTSAHIWTPQLLQVLVS